jgi:uncharacterized protein with HEPN domain
MRGKLGDPQRLLHIMDAINEIESYINGVDFSTFSKKSMIRFATIKQLEIIGEAANHLTKEFQLKTTDIFGEKLSV